MTEQTTEHVHAVSERIAPGSVSVTRIAPRRYEGLNERGAAVPSSTASTSRRASC